MRSFIVLSIFLISGCAGFGDQKSDLVTYGNAISTQLALSRPNVREVNPIYRPFVSSVGGVAAYTLVKLSLNWLMRNKAPKPLCGFFMHLHMSVGAGLIANDVTLFSENRGKKPLTAGLITFGITNKLLFDSDFSKKECRS